MNSLYLTFAGIDGAKAIIETRSESPFHPGYYTHETRPMDFGRLNVEIAGAKRMLRQIANPGLEHAVRQDLATFELAQAVLAI